MKKNYSLLIISLIIVGMNFFPKTSYGGCKLPPSAPGCGCCASKVETCQSGCICTSNAERGSPDTPETTIGHITEEFSKHRDWTTKLFFGKTDGPAEESIMGAITKKRLLPAMQLMTTELTTMAIQQVKVIGTFFDAKNQLETQSLFQEMTARAHKDYRPDAQLCEFGTMTSSLSSSNRNTGLTTAVISKRIIERQVGAKDTIANKVIESDQNNRLVNFIKTYCNKSDNQKNLNLLCQKGNPDIEMINKDINYTSTIDSAGTLDLDFSGTSASPTNDEKAVFSLSNNLFAHSLFQFISANKFVRDDGTPDFHASGQTYLNARSLMAKRSVATNSFAAITALKTKGDPGSQPFIYALLKEMGGDEMTAEEIRRQIGEQPSYDEQMKTITETLYQRPEFYSDLYDTPANVLRKNVALQAATLMQKRELYKSYLRSEMTLAVMLETLLMKEQDAVVNEMKKMK